MSKKPTTVTVPTAEAVDTFLSTVEDEQKRKDSEQLQSIMEAVSGEPATMWGPSIVGFGSYHYRYASGHEGDAPAIGFSPRKASLTLYITGGFEDSEEILGRLDKHKISKSCLHIKRLSDVDESVLRELIQVSLDNAARFHVEG